LKVRDDNRQRVESPKKRSRDEELQDLEKQLKYSAPLLGCYPLALGFALLLLLAMPNPRHSLGVSFGCTAFVLFILFIQFSLLGSPFNRILRDIVRAEPLTALGVMLVDVTYTPWFFMSVASVAIACVVQLGALSITTRRF
jgi:hypothetical protein